MPRLTGHIERLLVVLLYGSILLRGLEEIDKVPDELLLLVGHCDGGIYDIEERSSTRRRSVIGRGAKGRLKYDVVICDDDGISRVEMGVRRARVGSDRGSKAISARRGC